MDEIRVKPINGDTWYKHEGYNNLPRLERINHQLQEAKKLPNVHIYLKRGRKLRFIRTTALLKQKPLF